MFGLIKQVFIGLVCFGRFLASIVNTPGHTKCITLNNQPCITQSTLIILHSNEYIEGLRYYPFAVNLDAWEGVILSMIHPIDDMFQTKQNI